MSRPRDILLVDDNAELRAATRELLEAEGCRVVEAANGEEALARIESAATLDVLLSDVFMPGMDGLELVDRALRLRGDLGVVLYSSRGYDPALARRLDRGDVTFLPKPFSPAELHAALGASLEVRRQRRPGGPELSAPASRTRRRGLGYQLAALLLVAAGLSWFLPLGQPPALPDPAESSTRRGSRVELLFPVGKLALMPDDLRWREVEGAAEYRIELSGVDGVAIWEETSPSPTVTLPRELRESLHAEVSYLWRVEAVDSEGRRLAGSEIQRFQVSSRDVGFWQVGGSERNAPEMAL